MYFVQPMRQTLGLALALALYRCSFIIIFIIIYIIKSCGIVSSFHPKSMDSRMKASLSSPYVQLEELLRAKQQKFI